MVADHRGLLHASAYIPLARRVALRRKEPIPEDVYGAALYMDVRGFTALTEALTTDLGERRGAEEITYPLNRVYKALITELHRYC